MGGPYSGDYLRRRPSLLRRGPGRKNHAVRRNVRAARGLAKKPEAGDDHARVVGYFWGYHFPRSLDDARSPTVGDELLDTCSLAMTPPVRRDLITSFPSSNPGVSSRLRSARETCPSLNRPTAMARSLLAPAATHRRPAPQACDESGGSCLRRG